MKNISHFVAGWFLYSAIYQLIPFGHLAINSFSEYVLEEPSLAEESGVYAGSASPDRDRALKNSISVSSVSLW